VWVEADNRRLPKMVLELRTDGISDALGYDGYARYRVRLCVLEERFCFLAGRQTFGRTAATEVRFVRNV
jgi:hypothetical protein